MIEGQKPKKLYQHLGADVKLTTQKLVDPQVQEHLRLVGKELTPQNHKYMGTAAVHYYINDLGAEFSTVQQVCIDDISEGVALMGFQNLQIAMKQNFGRRHSTADKNDQRGNV